MVIELCKNLLRSLYSKYSKINFGSNELFTQKRLRSDDDDDDDDDCVMLEPEFKRPRLLKDEHFFSESSGYHRQSDKLRLDPQEFHSPFNNITNMQPAGLETQEEFLDYKSSLGNRMKRNSLERLPSPTQDLFSSFKFSPTHTSTVYRPPKSGLGVTSRKPLKSLSSSPFSGTPKLSLSRRGDGGPLLKKSFVPRVGIQSSGIRRFMTPRESIRLQDKALYQQLLEQQLSKDVLSWSSPFGGDKLPLKPLSSRVAAANILSKTCAIFKLHIDPVSTSKIRKKLEKNEIAPIPSLPIPILHPVPGLNATDKSPVGKPVPIIDLSREEEKTTAADDDVVITKIVPPPEKERRNSLEDKLQTSPYYLEQWLKEKREYNEGKAKEAEAELRDLEQSRKWLSERRRQEQDRMLDRLARSAALLDISYPKKAPALLLEEEPLPEITPNMERVIERALKGGPPGHVLADKFSIQITRRDLHTLQGLNWLNDEVINFYLNMVVERGQNDNYPSVYAFNTFFYSKLAKAGYTSIKRWTKKVDIFSYELLLVPVHLGMHWCLATIDFQTKAIRYYDSMLGDNNKCLSELKKYLDSEHREKKKTNFAISLLLENVKDIPQQMNGSDCGMFACKFAEYLSRRAPITFDQEHMPYFRRRMVYEIVSRTLL